VNINRLVGTVTSVTCAALGEVAIGISAGSINLPKSSYAIPVAGFLIAVAIGSLSDRSRNRSAHSPNPTTSPSHPQPELVHVLKGTQKKRNPKKAWTGALLFTVAYAFAITGSASMSSARDETGSARSHTITTSLILLGLSPTLAVVGVWLIRAVRTTLIFSATGITLSDAGGEHLLRWDQATNFHTLKPFVLTVYLVAEPVDGSDYFLGPWGFDKSRGLIRICDLTLAGIKPSDVDGAIRFWRSHAY
jgi:hypothetical protein